MGEADPELQIKLLQTYFKLIIEAETLPAVICFYTEGVHLVVEGSPAWFTTTWTRKLRWALRVG
jgi:hypothetical protein